MKSRKAKWIKIGHHKISDSRPNPYFRLVYGGFRTTICPKGIKYNSTIDGMEILNWYPNLSIDKEMKLHDELQKKFFHIGEWYKESLYEHCKHKIENEYGGINKELHKYDRIIFEEAMHKKKKRNWKNRIIEENKTKGVLDYF